MNEIFIQSEYITLGQFLKYVGKITNGGEAKIAVKMFKIAVNNAPEDRRGRKIYPGDTIKIEKESYFIKKHNGNQ